MLIQIVKEQVHIWHIWHKDYLVDGRSTRMHSCWRRRTPFSSSGSATLASLQMAYRGRDPRGDIFISRVLTANIVGRTFFTFALVKNTTRQGKAR